MVTTGNHNRPRVMNTSDDNPPKHRFNKIQAHQLRSPVVFLATGFGSGLSSIAPGTLGTLVAIPFAAVLMLAPEPLQWIVPIVAFVLGIPLCSACTARLDVHDHPGIVWDEIVGYFITMFMVPKTWLWLLFGFVLFRLFDIWKPWPISVADKRLKGGLGIMLDDVIAGLFALIIIQITLYLL